MSISYLFKSYEEKKENARNILRIIRENGGTDTIENIIRKVDKEEEKDRFNNRYEGTF